MIREGLNLPEQASQDELMMARAIHLASKGRFTTAPNPNVGCVIVNQGQVVGEGYHIQAGKPHAEVYALRQAAEQAKGATAYVTLEPCSHYGRTPPCAKGLIDAKVARVVVAMRDPNPQVAGRGIQMLREAGIEVEVGLLEAQARLLNPAFLTKMETSLPLVTVKVGASLDGKTALENGVSKWITGAESRLDVQRLRAQHQAIVTGIGTVLADDPSLNVRWQEFSAELEPQVQAEAAFKQPLRVVLDTQARLRVSDAPNFFGIDSPILLVSHFPYSAQQRAEFPAHVTDLSLAMCNNAIDLKALVNELAPQVNSILVEAGAILAGAFVDQGLANQLIVYQAPKLLGSAARDMLQLPNYQSMAQLPMLELIDKQQFGADTRYTFVLEPARDQVREI